MSDQNFSEVDKLLSSDFDEPKKVETPKPEAEVTNTETTTVKGEKQPDADMVVEEVKTTPAKRKGRTPKNATTPTKKATPKKATPTKNSPKKVEKEIVTDPLKVSTRKSTKHSDWSELIYGSSEKFSEGDTLAVRAPKDSGDQFWLCALDGFGTEENGNKDDLEITWFEAKGTAGVYVEGEEDDIAADSVICRTRLNSKDGSWVLPQVELKAIRDTLKLEKEESSEIILEGGDEKSDEASYKEGEEDDEAKRRPKREEKPKREPKAEVPKSGEKRKAAAETNGEPKPKRAYKKREKKVTPEAGDQGIAVEPAKIESEPPTTTTTSTFPSTSINPVPTPVMPTPIPMQMQQIPMQSMPLHMQNHPMQHMYGMHPMQMGYPVQMPNQMPNQMPMPQMSNHVQNYHPGAMQHIPVQSSPIQTPTPTPVPQIVNQPVESKTDAV